MGWFKKTTQVPPKIIKPEIGIVCQGILNQADINSLKYMGVNKVRLGLYGDLTGADSIEFAFSNGLDILVTSYRDVLDRANDRLKWPFVRWQYLNEPNPSLKSPLDASLDSMSSDVSPGMGHGTSTTWMIDFFNLLIPQTAPAAYHCYGDILSGAIVSTYNQALASHNIRDIWFTEIGTLVDANDLEAALNKFNNTIVKRVYIYALNAVDGYGLTQAMMDVIKKYIAV